MLSLLLAMTLSAQPAAAAPGPGISEALAQERAAAIANLRYELQFQVPSERRARVRGRVVVRFTLKAPHRIVLDFAQPRDRVHSVTVRGGAADFEMRNGHILIAAAQTVAGQNAIAIEFDAGDEALNRNDEFLYTLFVPARAHLAFPCFDQPDLKARYTLALEVPSGWQAVANGAETGGSTGTGDRADPAARVAAARRPGSAPAIDSADPTGPNGSAPDARRIAFAETQPLPTYLFAFAAGKFSVETATRNGRTLRMFHRETDAAKVARNRDAIFDLHATALAWLERYTNIPYPFGKFDFVLIPSFQFGGMEHAGAILYNASGLMLDESATQNQLLERASVIAHETSHMWFGDLVTMRWFNDVWMKEVFANFMAAKIVNPSFPTVNHELRFLLSNYPSAYQVDRTAGTNPIRQELTNLDDAGQLYGAIIYQKAPIVMRQLELIVGETAFRDGLREYLKRYMFANATWLDLVRILDARTPENVTAWSHAWVEQRGRPHFTTGLTLDARGRIGSLTLAASDPWQRGIVWPQRVSVALGYRDSVKELPAYVKGTETVVTAAAGLERPLFVLPNGRGLGYGLFLLDESSRAYLLDHVDEIPDALTRGSAWVTMWDNVLESAIAPPRFLDAAIRALPKESDEQNTQRILGYVNRVFWRFLSPDERTARGAALEVVLRDGLTRAQGSSRKATWFNTLRDTAVTRETLAWLERVWSRDEKVEGLPLAETDEIALALELAVREVPTWDAILHRQLERTQNPDRKARFEFVMPALSADPSVREQAFARFRQLENRRREPWVLESLQYLNHPLREQHARQFVGPALTLLREIQRTGDIFFPTRWTESTLWGHRSPEVAATVQSFLAQELQYPQRLRWTILSAADELFRVDH